MDAAAASPVATTGWRVDLTRSRLAFVARHMAVSSIHGAFRRWEADIRIDECDWARSSVRASVETGSIDTSNLERDDHLRKLFEVRRYPNAVFQSRDVRRIDGGLEVEGSLTLHGVTQEVCFTVAMLPREKEGVESDRMGFDAKTTISRKEFGLQWSAILEWTGGVGDRVDLVIHVEVTRP